LAGVAAEGAVPALGEAVESVDAVAPTLIDRDGHFSDVLALDAKDIVGGLERCEDVGNPDEGMTIFAHKEGVDDAVAAQSGLEGPVKLVSDGVCLSVDGGVELFSVEKEGVEGLVGRIIKDF